MGLTVTISKKYVNSGMINRNQEENLPPPSGHLEHPKYRADIDGLRAVAILSVVAYHAFPQWVKGGFIGVDIFFVISGFLISTIIFNSLERDSFSFVAFYSRRIRRIFPALMVVLIFCFAFGGFALLAEEYKLLGKHSLGAGFVSNFVLWKESGYFDAAADTKPLLHLWSLGIEEQFYIVWPSLLWAAWKKKFSLLTLTIAIATISLGLNLAKFRIDGAADFYSPTTRFWELLAGSLLAYITDHDFPALARYREWLNARLRKVICVRSPESKRASLPDVQAIAGAIIIVFCLLAITKETHFPVHGRSCLFSVPS